MIHKHTCAKCDLLSFKTAVLYDCNAYMAVIRFNEKNLKLQYKLFHPKSRETSNGIKQKHGKKKKT